MRSFLRNIWKSRKDRPSWKEFREKVREGKIKIVRKQDVFKRVDKNG